MFPYLGAGMVFNEEKRNRLAELIARRQAALTGAGGSAKNKGVVAIDSDPAR